MQRHRRKKTGQHALRLSSPRQKNLGKDIKILTEVQQRKTEKQAAKQASPIRKMSNENIDILTDLKTHGHCPMDRPIRKEMC